MADDVDPPGVGLADAIGQVQTELEQAIKDGQESSIAFRAGPVELEFEVAFTQAGGINGGCRLSVLPFGAKREKSSGATPGPGNPGGHEGGRSSGGAGREPGPDGIWEQAMVAWADAIRDVGCTQDYQDVRRYIIFSHLLLSW
jgi:hypothetical protein